jgi:cytochrome c oxidase subunit 4
MSHGHGGDAHRIEKMKPMYVVWTWLLVLTLIEVFLAYEQVPLHIMLVALLGMSALKAAMITAWFMHLKFERAALVLAVVGTTVLTAAALFGLIAPDGIATLRHAAP